MSEQPPDLVDQVAKALCQASCCDATCDCELEWLWCRVEARVAIAAVRAYDEANMARADEPATERAPPWPGGWEAF